MEENLDPFWSDLKRANITYQLMALKCALDAVVDILGLWADNIYNPIMIYKLLGIKYHMDVPYNLALVPQTFFLRQDIDSIRKDMTSCAAIHNST